MHKKLWLIVLVCFAVLSASGEKINKTGAKTPSSSKEQTQTVICPVMNKELMPEDAVATQSYKGKTYYLCCGYCVKEFKAHPEKYVK